MSVAADEAPAAEFRFSDFTVTPSSVVMTVSRETEAPAANGVEIFFADRAGSSSWEHVADDADACGTEAGWAFEISFDYLPGFLEQGCFMLASREDSDGDGLTDAYEVNVVGTNPACADTDGDGLSDGEEWRSGMNPRLADTDGDGLNDGAELACGSDPTNPDTDGDGLSDGDEVSRGSNPLVDDADLNGDGIVDADAEHYLFTFAATEWTDTDGDGLSDAREEELGTDPENADTDGDGLTDFVETCGVEATVSVPWWDWRNDPEAVELTAAADFDWSGGEGLERPGRVVLPFAAPIVLAPSFRATCAVVDPAGVMRFGSFSSASNLMDVAACPQGTPDMLGLLGVSDFVFAPFWSRYAQGVAGETRIVAKLSGGALADGWIVQFENVSYPVAGETKRASFQVAHLADRANALFVTYGDGTDAIVGMSLSIGAIGPEGSFLLPYYHGEKSPVAPGWTLAFHFGTGSDPFVADTDSDGLSDGAEIAAGTDPADSDTDSDGLPDAWELAHGLNPLIGSGWHGAEGDADLDGLPNAREFELGTDPLDVDTDDDGLWDDWEVEHGLDPKSAVGADGADGDPDGDGLSNAREYALGTHPRRADTDGDGLSDGAEVDESHTNPRDADGDGDGATDAEELAAGSDPCEPDSDWDGLDDGWEIAHGLDPLGWDGDDGPDGDPDGDGLRNMEELALGTDPMNPDTDGDGYSDGVEAGYIAPAEWIDLPSFDGLEDITPYFGGYPHACWTWNLPEPVFLQGVRVSSVTISPHGFICFNGPDASIPPDVSPTNRLDCEWTADAGSFTVAPYMDDLVLPNGGETPSRIRIGKVACAGIERYAVVYENTLSSGTWAYEGENARCSWALTFPTDVVDVVEIAYPSVSGSADGMYAAVGFQSFGGRRKCSWCWRQGGRLWTGLRLRILPGMNTDASAEDADEDGLADADERARGTDPLDPDTDHDGMPDGWEVAHGLNPLSAADAGTRRDLPGDYDPLVCGDNGPGAVPVTPGQNPVDDPDGDGLPNLQEYEHGTDPNKADSDGGGVDDLTEICRGTDPTSPSDDYKTPNEYVGARVLLGAVDAVWRMTVSGMGPDDFRVRHLTMTQAMDDVVRVLDLRKGNEYQVKLKWLRGGFRKDDPSPYGVMATVNKCPTNTIRKAFSLEKSTCAWDEFESDGVIVDNVSALLDVGDTQTSPYFKNLMEKYQATIKAIGLVTGKVVRVGHYNVRIPTIQSETKRFWINDDDDASGVWTRLFDNPRDLCRRYNDDLPGSAGPDHGDGKVNGRRDLVDFTPVTVDFTNTGIDKLPPRLRDRISVRLRSPCLKAVWTGLRRNEAKKYLHEDVACCGPKLKQDVWRADVVDLSRGAVFPKPFLDLVIASNECGVVLVEGQSAGNGISLELLLDGKPVATNGIDFAVSPVEDMYRFLNLRAVTGNDDGKHSQTNNPPNRPDGECDDNHFVLVHGFNTNDEESRAFGAEMFKRFWQSGMKARFTVVDWYGDVWQFYYPCVWHWWAPVPTKLDTGSARYYACTVNAFLTARAFVEECAKLPGRKVVLAHSLGNMLVSAAIKDFGLDYGRYYMLNAAVAQESYDAGIEDAGMVPEDWTKVADPRYRASRWSELFESDDFRSTLSWKGRFAGIANAVNFYSETEDVVGKDGEWFDQEQYKGSTVLAALNYLPSKWFFPIGCEGGWKMVRFDYEWEWNPVDCEMRVVNVPISKKLPHDEVVTNPLFRKFNARRSEIQSDTAELDQSVERVLHSTNKVVRAEPLTSKSWQYALHAKILADGIPAESRAAGAKGFEGGKGIESVNYLSCRSNEKQWPRKKKVGGKEVLAWHHSDIKSIAYFFIYKFFDEIVKSAKGR